jgi:hypothetical protein
MATASYFITRDWMAWVLGLNGRIRQTMFETLPSGSFTCLWTACPLTHPRGLVKSLPGISVEENGTVKVAKTTAIRSGKFEYKNGQNHWYDWIFRHIYSKIET